MRPDKYRKRYASSRSTDRLRRQIATEAAKRMLAQWGPGLVEKLGAVHESDFYAIKCKAAAVLGHAMRPGDLPSDSEVREQVLALSRDADPDAPLALFDPDAAGPAPEAGELAHIADHLNRFDIYRLRLLPLENVKQDPHHHPEGDALYHSLQVFELARNARPYDEEFLLAALLHDVGKAIEPRAHIGAAIEALRGTVTPRTMWLIEHHHDLAPRGHGTFRPLSNRDRQSLESSEWYDDLVLLREIDLAGTATGVPVPTVDEALAAVRQLEHDHESDDV
jgi:hypothetical protein